jgi:multimeric flavodoxin WrbA
MNLLIVSGSRNPDGQTARAAEAFRDGAGGGEIVFLPASGIERCRQCDENGWGICRSDGRCVIEDDFAALVDRIRQADVVAFATPVYFSDLSESIRAFLDRLRRTCCNQSTKQTIAGKTAVGICVAGGGGGGAPECCVSLNKVLGTCGFDVADMVPVRRQNLESKLAVLRLLGQSLAEARTK